MKKVKYLKTKYQNSIKTGNYWTNPASQQESCFAENFENSNPLHTNLMNFGVKTPCLKNIDTNIDKNNSVNDSKKMSKIKRLYGKSKSPSNPAYKFIQPSTNEGFLWK